MFKGVTSKRRPGPVAWWRLPTAAVSIAFAVAATSGCSSKPSFAVGDCVRIEHGIRDSKLMSADCKTAVGTFDPIKRVYRVDTIIDNTKGGCPKLRGAFPAEFVDEPDGVTYCLVQKS